MDKDTVWSIFEDTGNIDAYLLYQDLVYEDEYINQRGGREDDCHADENGRIDSP